MSPRAPLGALAGIILVTALFAPGPAGSAGSLAVPSTGSVGTGGLFLACRSGSGTTTQYYDQAGELKSWTCGAGKRAHQGVDIMGSSTAGRTPVVAPASGTVMVVERGSSLGWYVALKHGRLDGNRFVYTVFGHMGNCKASTSYVSPDITKGTSVVKGTLLGYQGDDGNACGGAPHVHWETRSSPTDVKNVFSATPASPNLYTGLNLTNGDATITKSVVAPTAIGTYQAPGVLVPTASTTPKSSVAPKATATPRTTVTAPRATATPKASARPAPNWGSFQAPSSWPSPGTFGANWPFPTPKA